MKTERNNIDIDELLEREIYPCLWENLDRAFPEFAFRMSGDRWVATHEETTRSLAGSPRPGRVNAYRDAPFGFIIHGGEFVPWLSYINNGRSPRGKDFIESVRRLAALARVPFPERKPSSEELKRAESRERRSNLLEDFVAYTKERLSTNAGEVARRYLKGRGFNRELSDGFEFGYYTTTGDVNQALWQRGYSRREVDRSGVTFDKRWIGRLVGPWRDRSGRIANIWARDLGKDAEVESKYLMLRGGSRSSPLGIETVRGEEAVLVEGLMDAYSLRANGIKNVIALGGAQLGNRQIEEMRKARIESLVINFDHDGKSKAGLEGTIKAVWKLADSGIRVYVIDPESMTSGVHSEEKVDPDSFVRSKGTVEYRKLLAEAVRGSRFLARKIISTHNTKNDRGLDKAVGELARYDMTLEDDLEREAVWKEAAGLLQVSSTTLRTRAKRLRTKERDGKAERELVRAIETTNRAIAEKRPIEEELDRLGEAVRALKSRGNGLESNGSTPLDVLLERIVVDEKRRT